MVGEDRGAWSGDGSGESRGLAAHERARVARAQEPVAVTIPRLGNPMVVAVAIAVVVALALAGPFWHHGSRGAGPSGVEALATAGVSHSRPDGVSSKAEHRAPTTGVHAALGWLTGLA